MVFGAETRLATTSSGIGMELGPGRALLLMPISRGLWAGSHA